MRPPAGNARRLLAALADFGFGSMSLTALDLQTPDQVVQLGVPPVRIDLLTSISGVSWDAASEGRLPGMFGDVTVNYIGRAQYLANKRAAGRKKDMADHEALGEA